MSKEEELLAEIKKLKFENELLSAQIKLKGANVNNHHAPNHSFHTLEQLTSYTINHTNDMICWVNEKAEVVYANEALCNQLGYQRTSALGFKINDLDTNYSPDTWKDFWKNLKNNTSIKYESATRTKQGELIPTEITANFFIFENTEYNCYYIRVITERKQAQEKIKVQELREKALIKAIPDHIILMNEKGLYIDFRKGRGITNTPEESLIGTNIYEANFPKDIAELIVNHANKAIETDEVQTIEYSLDFPNNSHVFFESRAVRYASNLAFRIVRDITERKQSEEKIRIEEERKNALLRGIPDIIFIMDNQGNYLDMRGGNNFGFMTERQILGKNIIDIMPVHIAQLILDANQKAIETGEIQTIEYELSYADTSKHYFESRSLQYSSNQILRIVREVTQKKQYEEKIKIREQHKRAILQAIPDIIFMMSEQGDYLDFRGGRGRVFINPETIIGTNILDSNVPKEVAQLILKANQKAIETGEVQTIEYQLLFSDGFIRHYESRSVKYSDNQILRIVREITESKLVQLEKNQLLQETQLLNEELRASEEEIRQTLEHTIELKEEIEKREIALLQVNEDLVIQNKQLSHYRHIVSHNLRSPVANILGLINVFKMGLFSQEEMPLMLEKLQKAVNKLDNILFDLNDVLSQTQIIQENKQFIDLAKEVQHVENTLKMQIYQSNAKIETDFSKITQIYTLESFIRSIFQILISNSIKYCKENQSPSIFISSKQLDNYICISFKDNGLGIDLKKYGNDLFNLYKRFHPHIEGKGVGLYLVKTQVEMLGGKIEVESEVGKGTTFSVFLK
jgi:PAS domain S-box-containing protein